MPLRLMTCGSVLGGKSTLVRHLVEGAKLAVPAREFVVDDLPGRDRDSPEYAGDLVAAATIADIALVVVDARRGLDAQVRRHCHLASLLGTPRIVVVVNNFDLVGYAQDVFERIASQFLEFARASGMQDIACIPSPALMGDNVNTRSAHMPWYRGPTLLDCLGEVAAATGPARSPAIVQSPPVVADQFEATIVWTSSDAMLPGRTYLLKGAGGEAA